MGIWACQAGKEVFDVAGLSDAIRPRSEVTVTAVTPDGSKKTFQAIARLDSAVEANYYRNGGILPTVLRSLLKPAWSGERLQSLWCNRVSAVPTEGRIAASYHILQLFRAKTHLAARSLRSSGH
jgi:hypothetical protein